MVVARIAVIGSGVAGLTSAYYLSKDHHVDIFESSGRVGGHTHTVDVTDPQLGSIPVDTGFIVFNETNYPHFIRLLSQLGVSYQNSDMSFSFECPQRPFYWGSDFPNGVFAQRQNIIRPGFYRFLWGVNQFNNGCLTDFEAGISPLVTLGEYLDTKRVSRDVLMDYVLPMTSAIWSASYSDSLKFPVRSFIQFWKNHQLLELGKGIQWKTISGGSITYVNSILNTISGRVHLNSPVNSVWAEGDSAVLSVNNESVRYDAVVVATHADTAYSMLAFPRPDETALLGQWRYSKNRTFLHTDTRFMPRSRPAWCGWNVRKPAQSNFDHPASVTYWMNRLQSIASTTPYLVTLNPESPVRDEAVIKEMVYTHPQMTKAAMDTQPMLHTLKTRSRIVFAGSYFGFGFHEDAVASAVRAVAAITATLTETKSE